MNLLATREALDRFAHELPLGPAGDRLRRLAETTRALFDQALGDRGGRAVGTAWADHDLGVLVAEAIAGPGGLVGALGATEPGLRAAGETLFLGARRRLAEALTSDPDDLACALALALGAERVLASHDAADDRLAEDLALVAKAVAKPHAGPRLAAAATRLVAQAGHAGTDAVKAAAEGLAAPVREAVERLSKRLPEHPDLALDRIKLVLLGARGADGAGRQEALATARGLIADHEARFGPSEAQREVYATLVQLRSRTDAAPADLAKETMTLLEQDVRERAADPKRTAKLLRTLERSKALTAALATQVQQLLGLASSERGDAWNEARALVFEAQGNEGALLALSEKAILADPKDQTAARHLFERLLRNLRQRLAAPFEATVIDQVMKSVPLAALGRLAADDIDALIGLLRETFGVERAVAFARTKLTQARELKGKEFVWRRAMALAEEGKDVEAAIDIGRRAVSERGPVEARLGLVRALVARGEDLDEADDVLRPLGDAKGALAGEVQALRGRIRSDPKYREARWRTLVAFEDQLGIGTAKAFELKVVYTSPAYALAEVTERNAPEFYDHRHLRVMLRDEDLPEGVAAADLKKGDVIKAPVRGQDATHERDRDNYRVYWVADRKAVKVALAPEDLHKRVEAEEQTFGIGSGKPVALKIAWDGRKKRIIARLLGPAGQEFRLRPRMEVEQLPEGYEPAALGGRGKRFVGEVGRVGEGAGKAYAVVGKVVEAPPLPRGAAAQDEAAEVAEAADAGEAVVAVTSGEASA